MADKKEVWLPEANVIKWLRHDMYDFAEHGFVFYREEGLCKVHRRG